MEPGRVRLRTYRQVWRLERVIYRIEGVRLPFAVNFRQVGVFVLALVVMVVLGRLPGIHQLPGLVLYLIIPVLAAWYLTSQTLDGKPPHRWLLSMLNYTLNPKRLNRFRPLPAGGRFHFRRPRG